METELWQLHGTKPVPWKIPYNVEWQGDFGIINPACFQMGKHFDAVTLRLEGVAERRDRGWLIHRMALEGVATKTVGGDPKCYLSWGEAKITEAEVEERFHSEDRAEFIRSMHAAGIGRSEKELEFLWYQFCTHALDYLVNRQKPVDMYFMRLHSLPFRANWKQVLLTRFPNLGKAMAYRSGEKMEMLMHNCGFYDALLNPEVLAYNTHEDYCYRIVEVEHRPGWWKSVRRSELKKLATLNVYGYANSVINNIKRSFTKATALYNSWLAQVARPCASLVESRWDGRDKLVPHVPAKRVLPTGPAIGCLPVVVSNKYDRFTAPCVPANLFAKDVDVPAMPDLQQSTAYVWDGRRDVPESEWEKAGGMPVFHATKEPAPK